MEKPRVNFWAVFYFSLWTVPMLILCIWSIRDGWFPSEKILLKHPYPADTFYAFNKTLSVISGGFSFLATTPIWIWAFGGRKPWVWTTTLVFIAIGLANNPIMGIPILLFWIKENNKAYYGKTRHSRSGV